MNEFAPHTPGMVFGVYRLGCTLPFAPIIDGFIVSTQGLPVRYTPTASWSVFAVTPLPMITPESFVLTVLKPPESCDGGPLCIWMIVPSVQPPATESASLLPFRKRRPLPNGMS